MKIKKNNTEKNTEQKSRCGSSILLHLFKEICIINSSILTDQNRWVSQMFVSLTTTC